MFSVQKQLAILIGIILLLLRPTVPSIISSPFWLIPVWLSTTVWWVTSCPVLQSPAISRAQRGAVCYAEPWRQCIRWSPSIFLRFSTTNDGGLTACVLRANCCCDEVVMEAVDRAACTVSRPQLWSTSVSVDLKSPFTKKWQISVISLFLLLFFQIMALRPIYREWLDHDVA